MDKHAHLVVRRVEGRVIYSAFFPGNRCPADCPGRDEEKNAPHRLEK